MQDVLYCDVSSLFKDILAKTEAIEAGGVLSRGNGPEDHDHPIPREEEIEGVEE